MRAARRKFEVETLEGKVLLSSVSAPPGPVAAEVQHTTARQSHPMPIGTIKGQMILGAPSSN